MKTMVAVLAFGLTMFAGCVSAFDIRSSDTVDDAVILTVSDTTGIRPSMKYRVVAPVIAEESGHGRFRKTLGTIQVSSMLDERRIAVRVLSGTIAGGVRAEEVR